MKTIIGVVLAGTFIMWRIGFERRQEEYELKLEYDLQNRTYTD